MTRAIHSHDIPARRGRCAELARYAALALILGGSACGDDLAVAELTSVAPTAASHGDTVTIDGAQFGERRGESRVLLVAIDDEAELDVSDAVGTWSDSQATFVVPASVHEEGYLVHVETLGVRSNCLELDVVLPPDPAVSVIVPPAAKAGDSITITGTDFGTAEGGVIFFPDTEATVSSWTATSVVITVPADLDTDAIRVRTGRGLLSAWFPFVIDEDAAPTLTLLQSTIFTPRCATGSCHSASEAGGLNLTNGQAYANLVDVASSQLPTMLRVDPFVPEDSLLYDKVSSGLPAVGVRMPLGQQSLSPEQIELIRGWIAAGAPDD